MGRRCYGAPVGGASAAGPLQNDLNKAEVSASQETAGVNDVSTDENSLFPDGNLNAKEERDIAENSYEEAEEEGFVFVEHNSYEETAPIIEEDPDLTDEELEELNEQNESVIEKPEIPEVFPSYQAEDSVLLSVEPVAQPVISDQPPFSETMPARSWKERMLRIVAAVVFLGLLAAMGWYFVYRYVYDGSNGGKSAQDVAIRYVTAISDSSEDELLSLVPRKLRSQGFGSSEKDLGTMISLNKKYGVKITEVKVESIRDINDRIPELQNGIKTVYDEDLDITSAKYIDLSAIMSYNSQSGEAKSSPVSFSVIAINTGRKWYVYTAEPSEQSNIPDTGMTTEAPATETTEIETVTEKEVTEEPTTEERNLELDFSGNSLDSLRNGVAEILNKERTIAALCSEFSDVFSIDDAQIKCDRDENGNVLPMTGSRVVKSEEILVDVPIKMELGTAPMHVHIGNPTEADIDISNGLITTLVMTTLDAGVKTYDVILPGNVTFGTNYEDVVKVYGEDILTPYDATKAKAKAHTDHLYLTEKDVYYVRLNNAHNFVYLGFDTNGRLSGIQWQYTDLTGFEERMGVES